MPTTITPGPPIVTLIRRNVKDTLAEIGYSSGYNTEPASVDSPEPEGHRVQNFRMEVQTLNEDKTTENFAQGHDERNWFFQVVAEIVKPESDEEDTDDLIEACAADIERALMLDTNRGDLAIYTKVTGWRARDDKPGVVVNGFVYYQTLLGIPNEQ